MSTATETTFFTFDKAALPDRAKYPSADLIILAEDLELTLHGDGRTERTLRRAWLFNSGFAREKLSDISIPYVSSRQEVKVHRARTFMCDGGTIDAPGYAMNEIVPFALDRAPDLGDVRDLVVSLVGTEVGGVSVLEYTVADREPWKGFFWGEAPLAGPFPILRKKVTLRVPKGRTLAWSTRNSGLEPEIASEDGGDSYVWTATDLPAVDPEDGLVGSDRYLPTVVYSAAGDWAEATGKFAGRVADATGPHPVTDKVVREKTGDIVDPLDKALALHKFVLEGVRTLDFHPALVDFTFRGAAKVLDSAYGTSLEKGVLLADLARKAGLKSRLFLGMDDYRLQEGVAFPGSKATTWVEIRGGKSRITVRPDKPAHGANASHLEDVELIPLTEAGDPESYRVPKPAASTLVKAKLTLEGDLALKGKVDCSFTGAFNPYFRIVTDRKTTMEAFAGECASKLFCGGKAQKVLVSGLAFDGTQIAFDFEGAEALRNGAFVSLTWPDLPKALHGFSFPLHRDERTTPMPVPSTAHLTLDLEIALPKDAVVKIPSPSIRRRGPCANVTTSFDHEGGKLVIKGHWDFPKKSVLPEDYGKFRKAVTAVANPESRSILLSGI